MLAELGLQFSIKGMDDVQQRLRTLEQAVGSLSSTVDKGLSQSTRHFDHFAQSASKMAHSVRNSMNLAKAGVAAFLAGSVAKGAANWLLGGSGAATDKWSDYLNIFDKTSAEGEAYKKHVKDLRRRMPGISGADYNEAMFQIRSLMQSTDPNINVPAAESVANLAKTLGPNTTMNEAILYARSVVESFGSGKTAKEKQELLDKVMAQTSVVLGDKLVSGHDMQLAAQQVAPLYAGSGKTTAEMFADLGTVGAVTGGRAGEIVRNFMSKEGKGYGKLAAMLAKEDYLKSRGVADEYGLSKKERKELQENQKEAEEEQSRLASRLLSTGKTKEYMRRMGIVYDALKGYSKSRGFDLQHAISESFGETAVQGLPTILGAWNKGNQAQFNEKLESADSAEAAQKVAESFKSIGAQSEIFDQKIQDLGKSFRQLFSPAVGALLKNWGTSIEEISDLVDDVTKKNGDSMKALVGGLESGFGAGFGGKDLGIGSWIKQMVEDLKLGEDGFNRIGESIGKIAGENLKSIVDTLKSIAEAGQKVGDVLDRIKPYLPEAKKEGMGSNAAGAEIGGEQPSFWKLLAKMGAGAWLGSKIGPWGTAIGAMSGMAHEAERIGGYNPLLHGDVPYDMDSVASPRSSGQGVSSPEINAQAEAQVNFDKSGLEDLIKVTVKWFLESDKGRDRGNALDWGMMP